MLKICIPQEDLPYFNKIIDQYPESVDKSPIKGFDGAAFFEIFIEISRELVPLVLSALDVYLNYVSVKMQRKELDNSEDENDNNDSPNSFEVTLKYGSQMIKYSNTNLKTNNPHEILKKLADVLEMAIEED